MTMSLQRPSLPSAVSNPTLRVAPRPKEQARFITGTSNVWTKDSETVSGAAYEAPPATHLDSVAFFIAPHVWGDTDRSRGQYGADSWDARRGVLHDFVRDYRWRYLGFEDAGVFYFGHTTVIEKGTAGFHQEQATDWAMEAVLRWQFDLSDEEYHRAQIRALRALALTSAENARAYAYEIGRSVLLHGTHIGLPELGKRIASLSKKDFQSVLNRHLHMGVRIVLLYSTSGYPGPVCRR